MEERILPQRSFNRHEDLLAELNRSRLNEEAVSTERVHFYKTDKGVNPKQEDPLRIFSGSLPILVSAPHAVRHLRNKKIKMSDEFTGSIVYLLNKLTGAPAITVAKLYGGDPNADAPCIYKERVAAICSENKIKWFIDIHGAARDHDFDIDLGTNGAKNLLGKGRLIEILQTNFRAFGLTQISFDHFAASGSNTVSSYVARELGIPAVQIEINKQYRVPGQNPQAFHRLLGALVQSIKALT